jgi:hypothetical protein
MMEFVIIFSFLLLRPSKTSEVLEKGQNFGFLTLKYAFKIRPWGELAWKKYPVSFDARAFLTLTILGIATVHTVHVDQPKLPNN